MRETQDRAIAPAPAGPPQGRAGDLDRRDLADHRGRAHRRRQRAWRACRATSRMSGSRGSRPCACRAPPPTSGAAAPAAPSPASATGCGTSRRPLRSSRTPSRKSSPPISPASCSISRNGASPIRRRSRFLDPPPQPALTEAQALLRRARRHRCRRAASPTRARRCARLPLPPRLARMVVDAAREGAASCAAEIAAVLTERGLGGNDVDLAHRLDELRRDRSRRAEDARRMAQRWAEVARALAPTAGRASDLSTGVAPRARLSRPHRQEPRRRTARSCSPTAAAPMSIPPRRWRASRSSRSPSSPARPRRAASCSPRRSRSTRSRRALPARSRARDEITFDAASASLRGAPRCAGSAPSRWPSSRCAVTPNEETARMLADGDRARSASTACRGRKALRQWRDRVMFLRRAEGDEWPDLSDAALAASVDDWLAPALARQDRARRSSAPTISTRRCQALLPWHAAPPARRRGADPFRRAVRLARADRLRGRGGAEALDPGAGAVRPRPPSGHRRRPRAARDRAAVAGAPAGAGDARPAGLLARQLCGREGRDERPLPRHPWPDDPLSAPADPPRQAQLA